MESGESESANGMNDSVLDDRNIYTEDIQTPFQTTIVCYDFTKKEVQAGSLHWI